MCCLFGGGMLTGAEIERQIKKGRINIYPYDSSCLNPNSYNLKLHPQLKIYKRDSERANVFKYERDDALSDKIIRSSQDNLNINVDMEKKECEVSVMKACVKNANNTVFDSCAITDEVFTFDLSKEIKHSLSRPIVDSNNLPPIDMKSYNETIEFEIPEEGFVLQPGVLYIGRTEEFTSTDHYIPMINGRSSGGRLGISVHVCAGFGDIGFAGTWTLEITVVEPVRIYPHVEIAQVCYFKPVGRTKTLYRGRYFGQEDATGSRFFMAKEQRND